MVLVRCELKLIAKIRKQFHLQVYTKTKSILVSMTPAIRKSISLFKSSQASPACPYNKTIKTNMCMGLLV